MQTWNQHNIHKHMLVYSSDHSNLGHVAEIFEDSFAIHKGFLFTREKYIPYSAITQLEKDTIHINLSADDLQDKEWERRPDYERHLGDPTQLMYDRGHGVRDPFEDTTPDQPD